MVIFYLLVILSHILQKLKILSVCLKEIFQRTHAGLSCFPLCIAPAHSRHWWAFCFNRKSKMKCYFSLGSVKGNTIKNTCSLANFFPFLFFFCSCICFGVHLCLNAFLLPLCPDRHLPPEAGLWDTCHFILGGRGRFSQKMRPASFVPTDDIVTFCRKGWSWSGWVKVDGPQLHVQV